MSALLAATEAMGSIGLRVFSVTIERKKKAAAAVATGPPLGIQRLPEAPLPLVVPLLAAAFARPGLLPWLLTHERAQAREVHARVSRVWWGGRWVQGTKLCCVLNARAEAFDDDEACW